MIELSLLGRTVLQRPDGAQFAEPSGRSKRFALLAYLALIGTVSRDKVLALFWPDLDQRRASAALRQAIYLLRRELGSEVIVSRGDDLALDRGQVWCDAVAFKEAIEQDRLEEAVELYQGDLLEGFHTNASGTDLEDWFDRKRDRLREMALRALWSLADRRLDSGELEEAANWARHGLGIEPTDERSFRRLLRALDGSGDRAAATREYSAFAQRLWDQLQVRPAAETAALLDELLKRTEVRGTAPRIGPRSEGPEAFAPAVSDRNEPLSPRLTRSISRRRILTGVAALSMLLLIGIFSTRREADSDFTLEESLAAHADPGIAVLPFKVNDPELDSWREGMVDLLSVNLDGVPGIRAIDNRTVLTRWAEAIADTAHSDLTTALAVARNTGARYALMGSMVAAEPDLRLIAEIYDARSGARLESAQVTGAPDSILVLVDRLTREILKALPREGGVMARMALAEITTDSLAALKAFLNGEALYRRADFMGATSAFARATEADSAFALAWTRLGDACEWTGQEAPHLCDRIPPGVPPRWPDEILQRLPPRKLERLLAVRAAWQEPLQGLETLRRLVRKYPDDPDAWYELGDGVLHLGFFGLADPAEADYALERAITMAPTISAEPYNHLIELALADPDSARAARLLHEYARLTRGTGHLLSAYRLAFTLAFGDGRSQGTARAAIDTMNTQDLLPILLNLRHPRFKHVSEHVYDVLRSRPDYRIYAPPELASAHHYSHGAIRASLSEIMNEPRVPPWFRSFLWFRVYQQGVIPVSHERLERVLLAGAADSTVPPRAAAAQGGPSLLLVGAYAVDRGRWGEYESALDQERTRARLRGAEGDTAAARYHHGAARALEGYALWKRGQKAQAVTALESAHRLVGVTRVNVLVRWWIGELLLEMGRAREAKPYLRSLGFRPFDPFMGLRLGRLYEVLGEHEEAREAYERFLLSWEGGDPELRAHLEAARRGLTRLSTLERRVVDD